jgi:hypothetical protein
MPAYLRDLPKPTCARCGRAATKELMNGQNAHVGFYCSHCGPRARAEFEARTR